MTDGNIQAARTRLRYAVTKLCSPRPGIIRQQTVYAPSLYDQLCAALAGTQGDNKTPAKSLPPIWIDATQLKAEIDGQTRRWLRRPSDVGTSARLTVLADRSWRPQDTDLVNTMTRDVDRWADKILSLLDPQSVKHITEPCPSCGRKTIYRRDSGGQTVRQPALRIVTNEGCRCGHCDAFWPPETYLFLCKLLGFKLPEGMTETDVEVGS